MSYTVTRLSTGKVEYIRAGRADDAIKAYKAIRVLELNAEYCGKKVVNTSRTVDAAAGGFVLKKDEKEIRRFDILVKTIVPTPTTTEFANEYQDATQADWESGKFHN